MSTAAEEADAAMDSMIATLQRSNPDAAMLLELVKELTLAVRSQGQALNAMVEQVAEHKERRYRGTYQKSDNYRRGNMTTLGGQLWCCSVDHTSERPGTGDGWQLMTKGEHR